MGPNDVDGPAHANDRETVMNIPLATDHALRNRLAAACLLGMLLALGGCRKAADTAAEAAIESATGHQVDVERDGGTTILRAEDGTQLRMSSGDDLQLPDGFPDDVYLPDQYRLDSVMEMPSVTMLQLSIHAGVDALSAEADQAMQSRGWEQVMQMRQASGSAVLAYEKGQRRASFTLSNGGNNTRTMLSVQLQDEG